MLLFISMGNSYFEGMLCGFFHLFTLSPKLYSIIGEVTKEDSKSDRFIWKT